MDRLVLVKKPPLFQKKVPVQSQSAWICKICKKIPSKYTCPRCNLPYCSVDCYKASVHQECSENFYQQCVMEELRGESASTQDHKKMEELLQKMNNNVEEEPDFLDVLNESEKTEDEECSLAERLRGIDLDTDSEQVWERLTTEEKLEFEQFLTSEDASNAIEIWEPWWNLEPPNSRIIDLDKPECESLMGPNLPPLLHTPDLSAVFERHPPADSVSFSIVNSVYSYCLVSRIYNGDHLREYENSSENLLEISTSLRGDGELQSAEDAIVKVFENGHKSSIKTVLEAREFLASAIMDSMKILGSPVYICAALSDIHRVLKQAAKKCVKKKQLMKAYKKVEYLVAFLELFGERVTGLVSSISFFYGEFCTESVMQNAVTEQVKRGWQKKPIIEVLST